MYKVLTGNINFYFKDNELKGRYHYTGRYKKDSVKSQKSRALNAIKTLQKQEKKKIINDLNIELTDDYCKIKYNILK